MKEYYNPETEEGRKNREINSKSKKEYYNPDTEEGRKNRENVSKGQKRRFNPNTESGRFQLEENRRRAKVGAQRSAEASFQKKKNNSILKELIFDDELTHSISSSSITLAIFVKSEYFHLTSPSTDCVIVAPFETKTVYPSGLE